MHPLIVRPGVRSPRGDRAVELPSVERLLRSDCRVGRIRPLRRRAVHASGLAQSQQDQDGAWPPLADDPREGEAGGIGSRSARLPSTIRAGRSPIGGRSSTRTADAPGFDDCGGALEAMYRDATSPMLSDVNHHFLSGICQLLGITTPLRRSSEFDLTRRSLRTPPQPLPTGGRRDLSLRAGGPRIS